MMIERVRNWVKEVLEDLNKDIPCYWSVNEITALCMCESCGDPDVETHVAKGLMQITPIAFYDVQDEFPEMMRDIKYSDVHDPYINIKVGVLYLETVFHRLIRIRKVQYPKIWSIIAYNWGLKNVLNVIDLQPCIQHIFRHIPEETQRHLWKYLVFLEYIREYYGEGGE